MALAADQNLSGVHERARRGIQPGEPVLTDADDGEPRFHARVPTASALTAAAAKALPPRRPLSAT